MKRKMKSLLLIPGVDKPVSELALGTVWFNFRDKERIFELLDEFVAWGGTTLDTARGYGESEDVIGLWMESRGNREKIFILTKGGLSKENPVCLEEKKFREKVKEDITLSLQALRTDYIDLWLLHRDSPAVPVQEVIECLNDELERGRIRAFGGSNWKPSRVDEANEYAERHGLKGFVAVSNNLSLAVPTGPFYPGLVSVDKEGERWHIRTRIPLFSWSSQARGFFTGRYSPDMRDTSHLDEFQARMVRVYCTQENFERLRRAKELGERKGGYSAMQIALAWVLHKPFPVIPIVGPRTEEELGSCVEALSIELNEWESKWLNLEVDGDAFL